MHNQSESSKYLPIYYDNVKIVMGYSSCVCKLVKLKRQVKYYIIIIMRTSAYEVSFNKVVVGGNYRLLRWCVNNVLLGTLCYYLQCYIIILCFFFIYFVVDNWTINAIKKIWNIVPIIACTYENILDDHRSYFNLEINSSPEVEHLFYFTLSCAWYRY